MSASSLEPVIRYLRRLQAPATADGELLARFTANRDADAFAELARRFGPMVLGVCRRILGDAHAAEDAFQTTFLTLTRYAHSLRRPAALPAWLHGVAVRTALQARARRRRAERVEASRRPPKPPADPSAEVCGQELMAMIDEEFARLPERYRLPIMLCGLDGLPRDEAAAQLGWSPGTLRGRLERGRELLRQRLTKRGLTVPAALAGVLTADATAAVPRELIAATTQAALAALAAPAAWGSLKALTAAGVFLLFLGAGIGAGVALLPGEGPSPQVVAPQPVPVRPAEAPPARVDAEGVPLPVEALARIGSSRMRHEGVRGVKVAANGQTILSTSAGSNTIHLWDAATGKPIRTLTIPQGQLAVTAFAADGADVLTIASFPDPTPRGFLRLDSQTGRERLHVPLEMARGRGGRGWAAGFAAIHLGGRTFGYDHADGSIFIGDAATGRELVRIRHGGTVRGVTVSPDGRTFAATDYSDTITLYDATGTKTGTLQRDGARYTQLAIFSPDGRTLAAFSAGAAVEGRPAAGSAAAQAPVSGELHLWDLTARQYLRRLQTKETDRSMALNHYFAPDGKTLATVIDSRLVLWDVATGREVRRFTGTGPVLYYDFSPDGKALVASTGDGTIVVFEVATGRLLPASANPVVSIRDLQYTDGGRLLIGWAANRLMAWNPVTGLEVERYGNVPEARALSRDGRLLVGANAEGAIQLWDAATGRVVRTINLDQRFNYGSIRFTPDGRRLITSAREAPAGSDRAGRGGAGSRNWRIVVWDVATGQTLTTLEGPQSFFPLQFVVSPDGQRLAANNPTSGGDMRVWDLTTSKEVQRIAVPRLNGVAISPNGRWLAAATDPPAARRGLEGGAPTNQAGAIKIWDIETGRELRSWPTGREGHVAFSPDGRMLASGSLDGPLRLWEVSTGGERHAFTGHTSRIESLAFAPDGRTLAAASNDAPVFIWDVLGRLAQPAKPPTTADLEQAWSALAGADAKAAFQALRRLVAAPEPAAAFLRERLKPAAAVEAQRVRELIRRLDSQSFDERQQAAQELERQTDTAAAELRAALQDTTSAEVRQAVQKLLEKVKEGTPEMLRAQRAVEALEYIATPAARAHLKALASGVAEAALTNAAAQALKRLEGR